MLYVHTPLRRINMFKHSRKETATRYLIATEPNHKKEAENTKKYICQYGVHPPFLLISFLKISKIYAEESPLIQWVNNHTSVKKLYCSTTQLGSHQIMFALNHHIQLGPNHPPLWPPLEKWLGRFLSNPSFMTKYATKDCVTPIFQPLQNVANHQLNCFLPKFCFKTWLARLNLTTSLHQHLKKLIQTDFEGIEP